MPSAAAADVIRQALAAGKVDELVISTAPVILAAESGASRRPPGKGGIAR
jgi:dihydrofolate reductase